MGNAERRRIAELQEQVEELQKAVFGTLDGEVLQQHAEVEEGEPEPVSELSDQLALQEVYGEVAAELLLGDGYDSVAKVKAATDEELRAVDGIGPKTLKDIRAAEQEA